MFASIPKYRQKYEHMLYSSDGVKLPMSLQEQWYSTIYTPVLWTGYCNHRDEHCKRTFF